MDKAKLLINFIKKYKTIVAVVIVLNGFAIWYYYSETTKMRHAPIDIQRPPYLNNYIRSKDGLYFFTKTWVPSNPPKGLIFIIHGFGEHIDRPGYDYMAKKFNERGFAVFGHDHEGHGRSGGSRIFIETFDHYCLRTYEFIEHIKSGYKDLPIYIFGHSMGGLIALQMVIKHPDSFAGVMVSSPALHNPFKKVNGLVRFLARWFPKLTIIGAKLSLATLSRNPKALQAYIEDPLVYHGNLGFSWLSGVSYAMEEVFNRGNEIKAPIIITHGDADQLCPLQGTLKFLESLKDNTDKKLVRLEGMYHEFFEDNERDMVIEIFGDWLDSEYQKIIQKSKSIDNSHLVDDH